MRNLLFPLIALLCFGCQKEEVSFFGDDECYKNYTLPFAIGSIPASTSYIDARTNILGPLRVVSGQKNDSNYVAIAQTIATTTPQLVLNGNFPVNKLVFEIGSRDFYRNGGVEGEVKFTLEKYSRQKFFSIEEMIDASVKVGPLLLNKTRLSPDTTQVVEENFELGLWLGDCELKAVAKVFLSSIPEQNGILECTQFLKTYEADSIRYQINFRFDDVTMKSVKSFKLHDGNMFMDFKIPR
ncbi:MAG: hypothetical protein J0L99_01860 [Chitinophagales bacterium]|nr:hypothetical protein [Chitinophagales bacterium]